MEIIRLKKPTSLVQIRLPVQLREQAKQIVRDMREKGEKVTESDIYRTAIIKFFAENFTDSKDQSTEE